MGSKIPEVIPLSDLGQGAAAVVRRVLRRLEKHPESDRRIPEFPDLLYREVIVAPYRFFYKVSGDVAWIVSVWHGAQLPSPPEGAEI